jgi:hypothetical protein
MPTPSIRLRTALYALSLGALAVACGDTPVVEDDAGPVDSGPVVRACTLDADCDDGDFCNGRERCMRSISGGTCVIPTPPCLEVQTCDEEADRCVTDCTLDADADGDGVDSTDCGGLDCDDSDPGVNPSAVEQCVDRTGLGPDDDGIVDRVDEDCDPTTLGPDADEDGEVTIGCCNGDVCGLDCRDNDETIFSTAEELCNERDDDCDGLTDEDAETAYYPDCDRDGFGDGARDPALGCQAPLEAPTCPEGFAGIYVADDQDCEDRLADVNLPETGIAEACNELDDDCNGTIDNDDGETPLCPVDGGSGSCVTGECVFTCAAGQARQDCNDDVALGLGGDGCETDTFTSGTRCGGCDADPCTLTCDGTGTCGTVAGLAVGHETACVVLDNGRVRCWGADGPALGTADGPFVDGLEDAASIVIAGTSEGDTVCALRTGGGVRCWGFNGQGAVGDGTTTDRSTPVDVTLPGPATELVGAFRHVCAVVDADTLCWGDDRDGQLGVAMMTCAAGDCVPTPTSVGAIELFGGRFRCTESGGTVSCTGTGLLGDGGGEQVSATPVAVAGSYPDAELVGGFAFGCIRTPRSPQADLLDCWGDIPIREPGPPSPVNVPGFFFQPAAAEFLRAGIDHVCGFSADFDGNPQDQLNCFGGNDEGQIGNGGTVPQASAVAVSPASLGGANVTAFALGDQVTLVLTSTGEVWGWGSNRSGVLRQPPGTFRSTVPVRVPAFEE